MFVWCCCLFSSWQNLFCMIAFMFLDVWDNSADAGLLLIKRLLKRQPQNWYTSGHVACLHFVERWKNNKHVKLTAWLLVLFVFASNYDCNHATAFFWILQMKNKSSFAKVGSSRKRIKYSWHRNNSGWLLHILRSTGKRTGLMLIRDKS